VYLVDSNSTVSRSRQPSRAQPQGTILYTVQYT